MNSSFYMSFLFILGVTLSLTITPSLISGAKNQFVFAQPTATDTGGKRPNILVIMGDDYGYSDIGTFGSEISTPNLDTLARDGKILSNYYTYPVCSPSRVTFLTGVDNHIAGIGTMYENIAPNQVNKTGYETYITQRVVTVAELLRDAGYNTLLSGKWHLSGKTFENDTGPADRGFDQSFTLIQSGAHHFTYGPYYPGGKTTFVDNGKIVEKPNTTKYSSEFYTDIMIDYINRTLDSGKPFFGYLSYQVAHTPFQAPQESIKKYEGVYDIGWNGIREKRIEKQKELGIWPTNMTIPKSIPPLPDWNALSEDERKLKSQILAAHAAMIEVTDNEIGKLIQFLKDSGQYDNTLIMFTSDNGGSEPSDSPIVAGKLEGGDSQATKEFLAGIDQSINAVGGDKSDWGYGWQGAVMSNAPFSGVKTTFFNGGIKSPFIIKEPNSVNTTELEVVKSLIHVSDMTPTFLEYAGVKHPGSEYNGRQVSPLMGKSIKPLLEGSVEKVHEDNEIISAEMFGNRAILMGDWKARSNIMPAGDGQWRLFNMAEDITEAKDLSKEHPDILDKMVSAYDKWAQDVGIIVPEYSAEQKSAFAQMIGQSNQTEHAPGVPLEQ